MAELNAIKKWGIFIVASICCLFFSLWMGEIVGITSKWTRLLGVAIWIAQMLLYLSLFYWTKLGTGRLNLFDKQANVLSEDGAAYTGVCEEVISDGLYQRLISHFDGDKPYLKAGINVADVAARLFTNKSYLSRLLNDKLNQNFNQFVNAYRIKEAQRLVAEEGAIPLPTLCKKVGFTSMATFTVAFKLNTGMTPGEWCKKQKRSS